MVVVAARIYNLSTLNVETKNKNNCIDANIMNTNDYNTQNETYKDVVYEIVEYLEKSMAMSKGGYYSAENADSEGEEGKFYTWTMAEIENCLTDDEFLAVSEHYSIEVDGNFEDEATGELTGTNIFYAFTHEKIENWDKIRKKLYLEREIRVKPSCDDKVLTDWNAWIVAALAQAGACFEDKKQLRASHQTHSSLDKRSCITDPNLVVLHGQV